MHVDLIDKATVFESLEANWNSVYASDPNAHIFDSWSWLRFWLEISEYDWIILGARPNNNNPYVAFLPLAHSVAQWHKIGLSRSLYLGGPPFADYAGFISQSDQGTAPLSSFARFIQQNLCWEYFFLSDVLDPRLDYFLRCFSGGDFVLEHQKSLPCPRIFLPDSWETYLQNFLSKKARFHLRKSIRELEKLDSLNVTKAEKATLEDHIEPLLAMWQTRHKNKPAHILNKYRRIFQKTIAADLLWLKIAWSGNTPVAGLAGFIDPIKKGFYGFMTAYNPEYGKISPGKALFGYAIREAIENKFTIFDLLRGGDEYKTSRLGARELMATSSILVHRNPQLRSLSNKLSQSHSVTDLLRRQDKPGASHPRGVELGGDLSPGDLVRVRSEEDIISSLNSNGFNGGCKFTEPMAQFCGKELRVLKQVNRYYDEGNDKMLACKDIVLLEGAYCDGSGYHGNDTCDRMCLFFWRTDWLERIDESVRS